MSFKGNIFEGPCHERLDLSESVYQVSKDWKACSNMCFECLQPLKNLSC